MREHLLGYLLDALDEPETRLVEERLATDSQLRGELDVMRAALDPLEAMAEDFTPPPGLAARTCQHVAAEAEGPPPVRLAGLAAATSPVAAFSSDGCRATVLPMADVTPASLAPRWHWQDMAVGTVILVMAVALLVPAVQYSRFNSRVLSCQNNLQQIGQGLFAYSDHHGGYFPHVATHGRMGVAGSYGSTLLADGYLQDSRLVVCPDSPLADERQFEVPLPEFVLTAPPEQVPHWQRRMGGSFLYGFGYIEDGRYRGRQNRARPRLALISDVSSNHGPRGFNLMYESGRIVFLCRVEPSELGDDPFHNDAQEIAAGLCAADAVLAPSDRAPIVPVSWPR
ncbi:MAG: hypothetical protein HQ581_14005 [Planctomycetes bacterium]|nr:hypothetical protein [Planctomycetota bacterium]